MEEKIIKYENNNQFLLIGIESNKERAITGCELFTDFIEPDKGRNEFQIVSDRAADSIESGLKTTFRALLLDIGTFTDRNKKHNNSILIPSSVETTHQPTVVSLASQTPLIIVLRRTQQH